MPAMPSTSRRVKREFDSIVSVIGDKSAALAATSIGDFFIMVILILLIAGLFS